jgi:hypothetical protein
MKLVFKFVCVITTSIKRKRTKEKTSLGEKIYALKKNISVSKILLHVSAYTIIIIRLSFVKVKKNHVYNVNIFYNIN